MGKVPVRDFRHVKAGDTVIRMLAGTIPMKLLVTKVDDKLIYCGVPGHPDAEPWMFDRATGVEEDDHLGWGVAQAYTGSFLTEVEPKEVTDVDDGRELRR